MTLRPETDLQVVVTNAAGVLSRWPGHRALPRGWSALGRPGAAGVLPRGDRPAEFGVTRPTIYRHLDRLDELEAQQQGCDQQQRG